MLFSLNLVVTNYYLKIAWMHPKMKKDVVVVACEEILNHLLNFTMY